MERVSLIEGQIPVVIFAPHGFQRNDENTAILTENIAKQISAFAIINKGWERADAVDCIKDKADCNNVDHCHAEVVYEEILEPIIKFTKKAKNFGNTVFLYNIHGMSNKHRSKINDKIDMVIGYGEGKPSSHTMDIWRKDFFMHRLLSFGINAYEGKSGGAFSGWSKSNMNQLFRKWNFDNSIQSLQLEIAHELRSDKAMCMLFGDYLATCINDLIGATDFIPDKKYKSY